MKTRAGGVLIAGALLFTIFLVLSHRAPFPADELAAVRHEEDIIVPVLERDAIRPIYRPEFIPATAVKLDDDALVLGLALEGQVKAYPVDVLTFREMVNDELAGIPILVTW